MNLEQAWQEHQSALDFTRAVWLQSTWTRSSAERQRATFHALTLEHVGFNAYLGMRSGYPYFSKTTFLHPVSYTWGLCNPDFHYRFAFLDGTRSYRIWGKTGSIRWSEFHALSGFWGEFPIETLSSKNLSDMNIDPDGSFELIASPNKYAGNWIELDPQYRSIQLIFRDTLYDWNNDRPCDIHIEAIDRSPYETMYVSEDELAIRLNKVSRFLRHSSNHWINRNNEIVENVGVNRFWAPDESGTGGIVHARYLNMVFDFTPDEALVIETDIPEQLTYWGVQVADLCWQTVDFTFRQSSLNGFQARPDTDGRVRIVVAHDDPGVANWLDTTGILRGIVAWRWVLCNRTPIPSVKKVSRTQIPEYLSAQTERVDSNQRRSELESRERAIRKLFDL